MQDLGPIHRSEYEIPGSQAGVMAIAEAPGRVHFLGDHGDSKTGLFLSAAIDRYMRVAVSGRKDASLRFYAADLGERRRSTLLNLKFKREDRWANHIKAAIQLFVDLGCPPRGLNFTLRGNIPQQAGLGSTTAIKVAAALALRSFFKVRMDTRRLLSKLQETDAAFFGKAPDPVDYQIAFFAKANQFLVVDAAAAKVRLVKSPLAGYQMFLVDSRVPRLGAESELRRRRQAVQKGLELLGQKKPGGFQDLTAEDLLEALGNVPEEIRRRSVHVVQEIQRIRDAEEACRKGDVAGFSRAIFHSHDSLRDQYEVSCPEVDWLVKRAQELPGAVGARMTGEGFGGYTYLIATQEAVAEYRRRFDDYERIFGFHPVVYEFKLAGAARLIEAP